MDIDRLLSIRCSDKDKLGMILSNNIDYYEGKRGGMISVNCFDACIDQIIAWKNTCIAQQAKVEIKKA